MFGRCFSYDEVQSVKLFFANSAPIVGSNFVAGMPFGIALAPSSIPNQSNLPPL